MEDDKAMKRLPLLVATAAAIALAVPAQADPDTTDAQFINTVNKAGITYRSPDQAIAAGKEVCRMMGEGQSGADVVQKVIQSNPGFAVDGAQRFIAIAASAYCPQQISGGTGGRPGGQ